MSRSLFDPIAYLKRAQRAPVAGAQRAPLAGALLVVLGAVVLAGWLLRQPVLVQLLPGFAPMTIATALGFILLGCAMLTPFPAGKSHTRTTTTIGAVLVLLAVIVLAEHLLNTDLGVDLVSLHSWLSGAMRNPGRMSMGMAFGFMMGGGVLLLAPRAHSRWMQMCVRAFTLGMGAIGLLGLVGYAVRAESLFPNYLVAGMALHTAAGLFVAAFGLYSTYSRFEWAKGPLFARIDDQITFTGAAIMVVIALTAGIATFALLQNLVYDLVGDTLVTARERRTEMVLELVQLRENNALIAATRPAVVRDLRLIHAGRDDGSGIANVRAVVEGLLRHGFSALSYEDADGKVIASGGRFAGATQIVVALATPAKAELLWEDGFVLRHRLVLRDAQGEVGTVRVEQKLPLVTRYLRNEYSSSATGFIELCASEGNRLHCFPHRLDPQAYFAPQVPPSGSQSPLTRALLSGESGKVIQRDWSDRDRNTITAYGPVGSLGLGMAINIDAAEIFRPIRERMQLAFGLLVLMAAGGMLILRSQVHPLAGKLIAAEASARQSWDVLRKQANELESSNKELEAFSYSVSHDLRAPLRGIDGFSQILIEDYASKLDTKGNDYLQRVRAATQRMGILIDDMLALSRVTRREVKLEPTDLSAMAEEIGAELREGAPQRQVEFVVAPGLSAETDPRLLRIALWNLLGNAWKFTGRRDKARIEFGVTSEGEYFVKDDGAGFDMAYAGKLFGAFQRMHGVKEFEGTGIGLATVQRIVHRLGGKLRADAAPDLGATFYFTLA